VPYFLPVKERKEAKKGKDTKKQRFTRSFFGDDFRQKV